MEGIGYAGGIRTRIFCGDYITDKFNTWAEKNPDLIILSVDYKMVQDGASAGRTHHSIFIVYKLNSK